MLLIAKAQNVVRRSESPPKGSEEKLGYFEYYALGELGSCMNSPSIAVLTGPDKFQEPLSVKARKVVAQYGQ